MNGAQMVVPWPRTDGMAWGIICPDHPTRAAAPTDSTLAGAEALAESCVCGHPSHKGVTLTMMDTPTYIGKVVRVGAYVGKYGRARLAFFGDHDDAGLVEVGFLDGTTTLVPFEWCQLAWPLPDEYRVIPAFPDAPDTHLTADRCDCTPGVSLGCDADGCVIQDEPRVISPYGADTLGFSLD